MSSFSHLKNSVLALAVLGIIVLAHGRAKADVVGTCNPDSPGQCSIAVNITGNILTVTVNNTSPPANGGFLTAVAFNLTAGSTINNFTTTNANFALFGPSPTGWTGNVSPDGTRTHLISATGNDYNGGGNPSGGTPPGSSVTFTVTLASLNGNTEASVFNSILVRQRGFQDGGSDKDALIEVPEPASMLLLGTGLIGVATGLRRRFRKR